MRKCVVQLRCHGSEITTILNEFNQSLEGKKNLIVVACEEKNFPPGNFLQQRQRNPTEKRTSSCTCSPYRVMFFLLKPIAWIFLTFLKLPNETNWTDISFFLMAFLISSYLIKCSATGKVSTNIFNLNASCRFYYLRHSLKVLYLKCDSKLKDPHFN